MTVVRGPKTCLVADLGASSREGDSCQGKPNQNVTLRHNQQFVHIPKCGGSTVEHFLRMPFQGHREMYRGGPWGQACTPGGRFRTDLFTLLRHPVERLASQYFFEMRANKKDMASFREVQERLCMRGTGAAHNVACVPKLSFFQYAATRAGAALRRDRGYDDLQFHYLAPSQQSTLDDTKRFLSTHFILVGVTERLLEFKVLLAHIFSVPAARITADVVKGSPSRPRIEALLNASELAQVEARNTLDLQLHRWAQERFEACTHSFGRQRLAARVAEAEQRPLIGGLRC